MTDKELLRKIAASDGKGLLPEEIGRLESCLKNTEFVSEVLKTLPEDSVSMAWRSKLNERLRSESQRLRKTRITNWIMRPALGLSLACALLVTFWLRPANDVRPHAIDRNVEQEMVQAHTDAVNGMLVAGRGVSSFEARPSMATPVNFIHWEESDLGDF